MHLKLTLFITLLLLYSCKETEEKTIQQVENTPVKTMKRLFLKTKINRLRMRQTPDLEGAVLKILPQDEIVEFGHDSTRFTTTIDYNNKTYTSNWYKIILLDNTEGWVYAAFLSFLNPTDNAAFLQKKQAQELKESSNENNAGLLQAQDKKDKKPIQKALIEQYKNYLKKLSKNDPESVSKAIDKYKSIFAGKNSNTCDAAYVAFDDFYQRVLLFVGRRVAGKYEQLYEEVRIYQSSTMRHDAFAELLGKNGFNFGIREGAVVLVEDVDFLYRTFYRDCSTPMRTYMNQYQAEVPNFWFDDEQLHITPKQLARWVLSWNYFVYLYPDFVWHDRAKKRLNQQLTLLLSGSSETLVFDKKDNTIRNDFLKAYQFIVDNYPKSNIGKAFNDYLKLLEEQDFTPSTTVTAKQKSIIQQFAALE